jgi:hypothetical protein
LLLCGSFGDLKVLSACSRVEIKKITSVDDYRTSEEMPGLNSWVTSQARALRACDRSFPCLVDALATI